MIALTYFGFLALRRGYATLNVEQMTAQELQRKMRHRSVTTMLRYINHAEQIDDAVADLRVPDVLRSADNAKPARPEANDRPGEHPTE